MAEVLLNLFYEEPDPDRWFPFDRYPRRLVRRIARAGRRTRGQMRVYLNLRAGLDRLGVRYRVNDYRFARRNPDAPVHIIGKPFVLDRTDWKNPIYFGASVFSHPSDDPDLFARLPVRRVLVPGPWMLTMFRQHWPQGVEMWPAGTDTDYWKPGFTKDIDVLIYDKILWDRESTTASLFKPIVDLLTTRKLRFSVLRYGQHSRSEFRGSLARSKSMIFLCEHETQGLAYQEALSSGVPVLAWDRGGDWRDPSYFPRVRFGPVSSVPYWDERCGERFESEVDFRDRLDLFFEKLRSSQYRPRDFILENLTLDLAARNYCRLVELASVSS